MTVDLSKIKPGDEVAVRARVFELGNAGVAVRALHGDREHYVLAEHILSHTPKALAVGDRVMYRRDAETIGTVEAIKAEWARVIDAATGRPWSFRLTELERADD